MKFLFVLLVLLLIVDCQGMVLHITSNHQDISEEATVEDNIDRIERQDLLQGPDDRRNASSTLPEVLVPSTDLDDQLEATTLQSPDRAQDAVGGSDEDASLSTITVIRTPVDYRLTRTIYEYLYETCGCILAIGACVYSLILFRKAVKFLRCYEQHNHAQRVPEPQQAPLSFQEMLEREDHHPYSILP
ncbi:uncharacterized protein LOC126185025 [Schistocerca cancellata]|uniref:uncharacterized protein LOC126185025 n=1 Tax=Schistocerca cancellata TaxID=274614 RepID=UPI00211936E9|nr:uncharacterized protein LOC126185025 [Schistocerca cancellata]